MTSCQNLLLRWEDMPSDVFLRENVKSYQDWQGYCIVCSGRILLVELGLCPISEANFILDMHLAYPYLGSGLGYWLVVEYIFFHLIMTNTILVFVQLSISLFCPFFVIVGFALFTPFITSYWMTPPKDSCDEEMIVFLWEILSEETKIYCTWPG